TAPATGIGTVDPATETWYLRNEDSAGAPDAGMFAFGAPGWTPVTGDWRGSGHTGIGAVDPATETWNLRNEVSAGAADAGTFLYGAPGWVPVTGNWSIQPPIVAGLMPNSGPIAGGTSVTVTGTHLTGATAVLFGQKPALGFTINSATSITAVSPP